MGIILLIDRVQGCRRIKPLSNYSEGAWVSNPQLRLSYRNRFKMKQLELILVDGKFTFEYVMVSALRSMTEGLEVIASTVPMQEY